MAKRRLTTFKKEYTMMWPAIEKSKISNYHVHCSVCDLDIKMGRNGTKAIRCHIASDRHIINETRSSSHGNLAFKDTVNPSSSHENVTETATQISSHENVTETATQIYSHENLTETATQISSHENLTETATQISSHDENLASMVDDESVVRAEALFMQFLIEHHIPLSAADHAGPLFQKMFPDSDIATKFGCAKTQATAILKRFSDSSVEAIVHELQVKKFSLAIDGNHSYSNRHFFPVLVTYSDAGLEKNVTMMLSLSELNEEASGESTFSLLDAEWIPWENCVALTTDNVSIMRGKFKGLLQYIQSKNPNIVWNICASDVIQVMIQHATKYLKFPMDDFLFDMLQYHTEKKSKALLDLCPPLADVHTLTHYDSIIPRILEQWEPLKMFFCEKEGKSDILIRIQDKFRNPSTYLYLVFLQSVLPLFTKTHQFFQEEVPLIHKLGRELMALYKNCLSCFIQPSVMVEADTLFAIEFSDAKVQRSNDDLFMGSKTREYLQSTALTDGEKKNFLASVRVFYVKICSYIVNKLPIQDELLKHAEVADISLRTSTSFQSIKYFLNMFHVVCTKEEINVAEMEFACFQTDPLNPDILNAEREDVAWYKIKNLKDHNRAWKYTVLPNIMFHLLLLPHSNAVYERVFTTIRTYQTDFGSDLNRQNLESIMIEKCRFLAYNLCCYKENIKM